MIDRPVALICTGHGTHGVRELVVLVPVRPRTDLEQVRAQVHGFEPVDKSAVPGVPVTESASEARGFGVAESVTIIEGDASLRPTSRRVVHKTEARLLNTPGIGWQVIAPGCPTCGGALAVPVAHAVAVADAENPPGAVRVDVDIRPA